MKKILCTILMCIMIPFTCFSLAGCKDNDYKLKNFYSSYEKIALNAQNLTLADANNTYQINVSSYKIDIDYTKSNVLSSLVEDNTTPYYQLKYFYQQLLDDSLAPMYFFGQKISENKKVSDKQTNKLFKNLESLQREYEDLDYYLSVLINTLHSTNDSIANLANLKKVFVQYEEAITASNNLSSVVCDVYFNTVLSNSNFNYSKISVDDLTESDLVRITIDTRARMYYYKSVYANIYNQLYIRGNNLPSLLTISTNIPLPTYTPYTNIKNISSFNANPSSVLIANKQKIYNNILSLYHIQNNFEQAYSNFNIATSKVVFSKLDASSTNDELNYGTIINQFANGIAMDSYEILNNLVNLLYH